MLPRQSCGPLPYTCVCQRLFKALSGNSEHGLTNEKALQMMMLMPILMPMRS